jgi:glycosyltransferase involved in cell wall biosynthesis
MTSLLVIVSDRLSDLVAKGEITARYYNPGELFDEVHILMTNNDKPDREVIQKTVGRARLHFHNLPLPSLLFTLGMQPPLLSKWKKEAFKITSSVYPSIIRVHGPGIGMYLAAEIKKQFNIPVIVSLHGNPDIDYARLQKTFLKKLAFWQYNRLLESSLKHIDHFIMVYSPIKSFFEKRGMKNYTLIYNTVGQGAVPKKDYTIQDLCHCICVGRQEYNQKDQRQILEAISQLDNVIFHLYGTGKLHKELLHLAKKLQIEERVIFKTSIMNVELMTTLHRFDFYIYNSINFEISKTVMEAALVGLPIIHNKRQPYLSEELSNDFILKVENSCEGYVQGITEFINNQELRTHYGNQARQYALAHWSPEVTEKQVVELYNLFLS